MKWEKKKKDQCLQNLEGQSLSVLGQSGSCIQRSSSDANSSLEQHPALTHHLPTSCPHWTCLCSPRGAGPPPCHNSARGEEASKKVTLANEWWLLGKSALFLMGFAWLISSHICSSLSSSYKSTKVRGRRKGIRAKDGQKEVLILKRENNQGSGEHALWAVSEGGSGEHRAETEAEAVLGWGTSRVGAQVLVARVPPCRPARSHQHSLSATVPVLWAAAAAREENVVF